MARKKAISYGFHIATPIAAVLLLLVVFVSVGYFFQVTRPDPDAGTSESRQAALAANRMLWDRRRPLAYRYTVDRDCDCATEYRRSFQVTERGTGFDAVFPVPVETRDGTLLDRPPEPLTIEGAFALVADSLRDGADIDIRYESQYGFPLRVSVSAGEAQVGQESVYEIRDFEVLEYR